MLLNTILQWSALEKFLAPYEEYPLIQVHLHDIHSQYLGFNSKDTLLVLP